MDELSKCLVSWCKGQAGCLELGGPQDMWLMEHSQDTLGWLTFSFHPPSPLPAWNVPGGVLGPHKPHAEWESWGLSAKGSQGARLTWGDFLWVDKLLLGGH